MERSKKRRRKRRSRRSRSRGRRKHKFSRSFCICIITGKAFWNSCTVPKVMLNRQWKARFLIFYVKKGSLWNTSGKIHLGSLGIKLVVVCNCTTCFTLLSQMILITCFFLFIFVFALPEPDIKIILLLQHCFLKKIPTKRKSLTQFRTDIIVFYKIQGKSYMNKMRFSYRHFNSCIS